MSVDVLLLFETTGLAAEPFERLGMKTACVDLEGPEEAEGRMCLAGDILQLEEELTDLANGAKIIFGFPPCDDLSVCGAGHFASKRKKDPKFQDKAVHLARSVERIGNRVGVPWALENPTSRLSTLFRKPDFKFNPWEYGGWLPVDDVHPRWPKYIAPRDAYPKTTHLWAGGGFKMPEKRPVEPEPGHSRQHRLLGGKSHFTKTVRAASPRGFFTALANKIAKEQE